MALFNKPNKSTDRVALHLAEEGVALAAVDTASLRVQACRWLPDAKLGDIAALKQLVEESGLTGAAASVVLPHSEYQLLLVEAPAVAPEEMAEAVRWRVSELVPYDITAAVVDYIELPDDAYHGRSRMLYVVVMPQQLSVRIEHWLAAVGLQLDCIDIPELALHNLMPLIGGEASRGRALLYLDEPSSLINLVADQAFYLTRRIDTPLATLAAYESEAGSTAAPLLLDIQRSLDYYQSQIGKPPCMALLVCPLQTGDTSLLQQLQQNLTLSVELLDLAQLLTSEAPLTPSLQRHTLIALAAALRQLPAATAAPKG